MMALEIVRLLFFGLTGFFGAGAFINSITGSIIIALIVGFIFSIIFVFALKKLGREIRESTN